MTQQPDLTIPFDASVVDEEALRALRAVQRTVPAGDGGASGNLVGGTEAVAAFGMVPGAPSGGGTGGPHGVVPLTAEPTRRPADAPLDMLDAPAQAGTSMALDAPLPEPPTLVPSAASHSLVSPRIATSRGSSGYTSPVPGSPIAPESELAATQFPSPDEQDTITSPETDEPAPDEPQDIAASPPLMQVTDAEGK